MSNNSKRLQILESYYRTMSQNVASNETFKREKFLVLLAELFPSERDQIEKYMQGSEKSVVVQTKPGMGRIDSYYGNLVIEFERDLSVKAKYEEGSRQISEYVSGLWNEEGKKRKPYIGIVTDGLRWICWHPYAKRKDDRLQPEDIELRLKEDLRLESAEIAALDEFYHFLDRNFFREQLLTPTTDAFKNDFGLESALWDDLREALETAFAEHRGESEVETAFEQWGKYLQYTYGSVDAGLDLFLRHSYLSVLARFLVATALWPAEAGKGDLSFIRGVVDGSWFIAKKIRNLADEDFFHWTGHANVQASLESWWLRVLNQLKTYDFARLDEDILKGVYQELVDPKDRHDLGEYYTPDWLCEKVVDKLFEEQGAAVENGDIPSLIDPTCGSGSFLRAGLRKIMALVRERLGEGADWDAVLEAALDKVYGIDINPLAVTISRANYVLAIREELAHKKRPAFIPVFLADSLFMPLEEDTGAQGALGFDADNVEVHFLAEKFLIPRAVFQQSQIYDELVLLASEAAKNIALEADSESVESILNALRRRTPTLSEDVVGQAANACFALARAMAKKIRAKENHIWSFILRNTYRPAFFKKRFDIIAGNPPWLSYRYIADPSYQARVKELAVERYQLAPRNQALMTHMELASVFLVHAADTYLKNGGHLGFVMPRSLFNADQHEKFRSGSWKATCSITEYWDLAEVKPLFNVPTCVVFADAKKAKERKSWPAQFWTGDLKGRRNLPWDKARGYLDHEEGKLWLARLGKRSALSRQRIGDDKGEASPYLPEFFQGATIVPRNFYFIETPSTEDLEKDELYVRTDPEQAKDGKAPWKEIFLSGSVERELLFRTALSKHLLPFHVEEDLPWIVLPLLPVTRGQASSRRVLADAAALKKAGLRGGAEWFAKAEREWERNRGAKNASTLEEWLNYQQKLIQQMGSARYFVLYNASGTNLSAAILDIGLRGSFFADAKTYWFATDSIDEANYLASILNSETANEAIKPFQSSGSLGERDIHKLPLELPLPRFDRANKLHADIASLSAEARALVGAAVTKGALAAEGRGGSLARRRAAAREVAALPLAKLDRLVKRLLES